MDRHELLRRITSIRLNARVLAEELLAGEYSSGYRGQGIEFDQVRLYEPGDDIRSVDWNVSARFSKPYVKLYREERELTMYLILDCSASMFSPLGAAEGLTRYEQGLLTAAILGFSAEMKGQPVGASLFDRETKAAYPPRRGHQYFMIILKNALALERGGKGSDLGEALRQTGRILKRKSLVAVISDFLSRGWERELGDLAARHDVIAIRITAPTDKEAPDLGLAVLRDPETGYEFRAPTGFRSFGAAWENWHADRAQAWEGICRKAAVATLEISTTEEPGAALSRFFRSRRR